jgi:plastocyanin
MLMRAWYATGWKRASLWLGVWCLAVPAFAQQEAVTVQVEVVRRPQAGRSAAGPRPDASNVAVWLTPMGGAPPVAAAAAGHRAPQLLQRNKTFAPHVLVVESGAMVQFPNQDPFFHNVFSLFAGKRFDLGLYEAGSSRSVRFDRPGASFLFCNIHPDMSAVIVVVSTPYYGLSDASGKVSIAGVPDGRYQLKVWYERSAPEDLRNLEQTVTISGSARSLGPIPILDNGNFTLTHKNKYGQDYVPPLTNTAY